MGIMEDSTKGLGRPTPPMLHKYVREPDPLMHEEMYTITFAREEGGVFETYLLDSEAEAERILTEYYEHGTFTRVQSDAYRSKPIYPVVMFKSKVSKSLRNTLKMVPATVFK